MAILFTNHFTSMGEDIKILLIDDDEEDYIITQDIIADIPNKKYKLEWVNSYEKGIATIHEALHDIYLVDYRLGVTSGLELIRQAIEEGCTAPLILLTGQGDLEIDEKAMKAGAADYIVKATLNPYQLERSVRYSIEHARNLKQIRQLNMDLERRVEQRTKDLELALKKLEHTNENLKKAEKETLKALEKERELNTMKSKFVTIASHEFRTPLSTILSSASLIAKYNAPGDEEKRNKHISRIKSSVNNLTGILNDFLSIGKLEEGKITNDPVSFDITHFSEELIEEITPLLKEGQYIEYSHQGDNTSILTDKQLLKNALLNLLSNASKYSEAGKPIELTSSITDKACMIAVTDHGIGIPDTDKQHLFSRFYRAQNVTNIQGTGLGLTIVKRYVELMSGMIKFNSELNKGSTFTIMLPLAISKSR
jgi:signal transduction histidine kinase